MFVCFYGRGGGGYVLHNYIQSINHLKAVILKRNGAAVSSDTSVMTSCFGEPPIKMLNHIMMEVVAAILGLFRFVKGLLRFVNTDSVQHLTKFDYLEYPVYIFLFFLNNPFT